MTVCCESGDANKNVSNAQRSIRVAALPYCGHFFDLSVARCGEWKDSGWIVGKPSLTGLWKGCPSAGNEILAFGDTTGTGETYLTADNIVT